MKSCANLVHKVNYMIVIHLGYCQIMFAKINREEEHFSMLKHFVSPLVSEECNILSVLTPTVLRFPNLVWNMGAYLVIAILKMITTRTAKLNFK